MAVVPAVGSIVATLVASVRSVGTAVTMASVGLYAHHRGFVDTAGKRTLAVISQQITFPLFLFTKIIYCNQNWSDEPCPDVTRSLRDVWMLLLWPLYVVGMGLLVGTVVAHTTRTPAHQVRAVLAACCFGNSTGLPITLLTVVHSNFPNTSDLGHIDPTLFLSVYLLLYPVLQWGLGGWLLAPTEDDEKRNNNNNSSRSLESNNERSFSIRNISESFPNHVLSYRGKDLEAYYRQHRKGLTSTDEGLYMTELDLPALLRHEQEREATAISSSSQIDNNGSTELSMAMFKSEIENNSSNRRSASQEEINPLLPSPPASLNSRTLDTNPTAVTITDHKGFTPSTTKCHTIAHNIWDRCLQPPVIGALAGIVMAMIPGLRGLWVDLVDRDSDAPLQWLFDGLYAVGATAVPINMVILGCNLSASLQQTNFSWSPTTKRSDCCTSTLPVQDLESGSRSGLMSTSTMVGIVVGKMVVLPFIGILTAWILKNYVWDIPSEIDGSFYLVLMIVFLCPTANNVMVMVELSGSGANEGISQVIALQYAVAPLVLSITMTIAIGVASEWS